LGESVNRRGFLGSLAALLAVPKVLFSDDKPLPRNPDGSARETPWWGDPKYLNEAGEWTPYEFNEKLVKTWEEAGQNPIHQDLYYMGKPWTWSRNAPAGTVYMIPLEKP